RPAQPAPGHLRSRLDHGSAGRSGGPDQGPEGQSRAEPGFQRVRDLQARLRDRRVTARRVLTALVALVLTTAFAPTAAAAPAPLDDTFYVPPSPLPAGKPGDVIRWRPSNAGPRAASVDAWQVMYLSTNALGQPDAVTGTVLVPKN